QDGERAGREADDSLADRQRRRRRDRTERNPFLFAHCATMALIDTGVSRKRQCGEGSTNLQKFFDARSIRSEHPGLSESNSTIPFELQRCGAVARCRGGTRASEIKRAMLA